MSVKSFVRQAPD